MSEPPNDQPAGKSETHGSCVAEGTDWASRTNTLSSTFVQSGVWPVSPDVHAASGSISIGGRATRRRTQRLMRTRSSSR